MKKTVLSAAIFLFAGASLAQAADVGVGVDIHIGNRPPAIAVPVPAPPIQVVIEEPPIFIYPPSLGFYVAVGVPYDIFFVDNYYYLYRGNAWYRAPGYNGPWVGVRHKRLPPGLRRHKHDRIVRIRDVEYRRYQDDRDHYRGRHFRPDKHEMKERRKEEKREMKEERKEMKEERKHGKGHGKHD